MAPVLNTNGELLELWERAETDQGVPYYINHVDESTQWDHPVIEKLIEDLECYSMIKYAAYRTAMKITKIQRTLNLECINLSSVISCFKRSNIVRLNGQERKHISCNQLQTFMVELFAESQTLIGDAQLYAELLTNLMLDICDLCRKGGKVPVLYIKVYLIILCTGRLPDKYKCIFDLVSDDWGKVNELDLTKLFYILSDIAEFLFEGNAFGSKLVSGAVKSCMQNLQSVTYDQFIEWLLREPQNLVWISTLTRLKAAERVQHDVKCKVCKKTPIFGLRYSCLKCLKYNQCQQCFFLAFHNHQHKVSHPMQEYCTIANPMEETKVLLMKLRNKLKFKSLLPHKKRYMPVNASTLSVKAGDSVIENKFYDQECQDLNSDKVSKMMQTDDYLWEGSRIVMQVDSSNSDDAQQKPSIELESIIVHLEDENRLFLKELDDLKSEKVTSSRSSSSSGCSSGSSSMSGADYENENKAVALAQQHNQQLQVQIDRLRKLLQVQQPKNPGQSHVSDSSKKERMQSTPTADEHHVSFKNLSPIEVLQDSALSKSTSCALQSRTPLSSDDFVRHSLRRRVLQQKHFNSQLPESSTNSNFKFGVSKSKSLYGIEDLTTSLDSRAQFNKSSSFSLPYSSKNNSPSFATSKNELQEIINHLENISHL